MKAINSIYNWHIPIWGYSRSNCHETPWSTLLINFLQNIVQGVCNNELKVYIKNKIFLNGSLRPRFVNFIAQKKVLPLCVTFLLSRKLKILKLVLLFRYLQVRKKGWRCTAWSSLEVDKNFNNVIYGVVSLKKKTDFFLF